MYPDSVVGTGKAHCGSSFAETFQNQASLSFWPKFKIKMILSCPDSHTTMINGLGVLGWGVGGVEAEAVMLGQPISMVLPKVVGYKITGKLGAFVTSTDVVLTITKHLRQVWFD